MGGNIPCNPALKSTVGTPALKFRPWGLQPSNPRSGGIMPPNHTERAPAHKSTHWGHQPSNPQWGTGPTNNNPQIHSGGSSPQIHTVGVTTLKSTVGAPVQHWHVPVNTRYHLLKNFLRLNDPEVGCCDITADDDDNDVVVVAVLDLRLVTFLASLSRCLASRSRCLRSRSKAARMSFSCFLSWSRSLLELTPRDCTHRPHSPTSLPLTHNKLCCHTEA